MTQAASRSSSTADATVARLLIVEDEPIVGWQLSEAIEDLGYEVCGIAADADEAVRLAVEHEPDLILMGMFGWSEARTVLLRSGYLCGARSQSRPPLTFAQDPATCGQLDALAPAAILSKPVHAGTLRPVLTRVLGAGRSGDGSSAAQQGRDA